MPKILQTAILPEPYFLEQLRIEKRRADRSGAPLSIALVSFDEVGNLEPSDVKQFLNPIQKKIRETDILGFVGKATIGVILPHTDKNGVQQLRRKIINGHAAVPFNIVVGTYPDQLFEKVLAEGRHQPHLDPICLDHSVKPNGFRHSVKRSLDIIGSCIGILVFTPVFLVVGLAIKATSPGPVIFKQIRLGKGGARFTFYKLRSMYVSADDRIHRDYVTKLITGNLDEINQGNAEKPLYKIKSDPRVTPIGRFIRKTSIDELPQLFNVLKGDMSLVGPRPPLPYEVDKYEAWHVRRILDMKPGITGLWQVQGRSRTSFDDMVRLDLQYVQNWSLSLDARILISTLKAVLRSSGAH